MIKIFQILIFNYGIGFLYRRYRGEANPKHKKYDNSGSIKKFKIEYKYYRYSDYQIAIRLFYNHNFIIRIYLNR